MNEIEKLRLLLSEGQIEMLFEKLIEIQGNKKNTLLLLQSNFKSIKDEAQKGVISHQDTVLNINKIKLALLEIIDSIEKESKFLILDSREERTKKIIEDLEGLIRIENYRDISVWSISFLSIFALGSESAYFEFKKGALEEKGIEKEKRVFRLLEKEKELMLNLAAMGCEIRCIISPANPKNVSEDLNDAIYRTIQLLELLNNPSNDPLIEEALKKIQWAITEYPQRNVYIIGNSSIYEGYKKGHEQFGFGLSSRQTFKEVIYSNSKLYEKFFEELSCNNLSDDEWKKNKHKTTVKNSAAIRKEYVVFQLEKSLKFLNSIVRYKKPYFKSGKK